MMLLAFGATGLSAQVPSDLCPLRAGERMPDAAVRDVWGKAQQLRRVAKGRDRLVVFHQGAGSLTCVSFLKRLQEVAPELQEIGFEVVVLGPGKSTATAELVRLLGVTPGFWMLADEHRAAAAAFGLLFREPEADALPGRAKATGTQIAEPNEGTGQSLSSVPAMYIVDKEDRVRFAHIETIRGQRIAPAVLLAGARSVREQDVSP